ncbi:MAG: tetratricopeptide repeat protein [Kiloniellales bacterium]|nr:tetratricopeptide repeat protein [Kiloniellales bacterium]
MAAETSGEGPGSEQRGAVTIRDALQLGRSIHKTGDLAAAAEVYHRILRVAPDNADALHLLGMVHYQTGDTKRAIGLLRRSIASAPDFADVRNNLANILKIEGRREEAIDHYRKALELDPSNANAYNNLGIIYRDQGRPEDAARAYEEALARDPELVDAAYNLGNLRLAQDRPKEAAELFQGVIAAHRGYTLAYRPLSESFWRLGRKDDALKALESWLELEPAHPVATHLLTAYKGETPPSRASDDYVRGLFAAFADNFDGQLKRLRYQAPDLVVRALGAQLEPDASLDVLDAGCGTGLCGPLLRPYARRLIGLDLSPEMLAKARRRKIYDELVEAELAGYLPTRPAAYDLAVCVDTLVYFGDLEAALSGFAASLRPGGLVAFTVERAGAGAEELGYRLTPSGRYAHADDYVRAGLNRAGLALRSLDCAELRMEHGQAVEGLVVLAAKRPCTTER